MANRLPQVPWNTRDAIVVFLFPWIILPVFIVIGLSFVASDISAVQNYLSALADGDLRASFGLIILDLIGSFALLAYFLKKYDSPVGALGLRPFNIWRAALNIALIFVVFFIAIGLVYGLVSVLVPQFNPNEPQVNEFTQNTSSNLKIYELLALVIIPPLVEEPVFRGFMFPAFAKRFGLILGAGLSSVLFGFAHMQANVGIYTFVLGLLLCWLYARLGSIIPGTALHMLNNYIAYTAIK